MARKVAALLVWILAAASVAGAADVAETPRTPYTDPEELQAVYEMMAATGNGWAAAIPDVCRGRWHGIECQLDGSGVYHVTALAFGALSEDTAFPVCGEGAYVSEAVGRLTRLERLAFFGCCVGNPTPIPGEALAQLGAGLRALVLRGNGHVGVIPAALGALAGLETLDLHGNSLEGAVPPELGRLSRLLLLDVSGNRLMGPLPEALARLSSLVVLDASQNALGGPLPDRLFGRGGLRGLQKLDLSSNAFSGPIPPSLGSLPRILLLDLSRNAFSGALPASLFNLSRLHALLMDNAGHLSSSPIPPSLSRLHRLHTLVLSSLSLPGPIPDIFASLPALTVLRLDHNRLQGPIPASLGALPRLADLRLDSNLLSGPIPFSREFIWRLGRRLRLASNLDLCFGLPGAPADSLELQGIVRSCAFNSTMQKLSQQQNAPSPPLTWKPPHHISRHLPFKSIPLLQASSAHHKLLPSAPPYLLPWFAALFILLLQR